MVNPLKVLGREIHDVANGDLHLGADLKAPEVTEASSKEALEAYRVYSTQKNLLADRVGFIERIIEKFAGILLGASATFFGVFLGSGRGNASDSALPTNEQLGEIERCASNTVAERGLDELTLTGSSYKGDIVKACKEEVLETGDSNTLFMAGMVVLGSLALSFVGLLFKQFVTRELTDKGAYTNDYYRKAQAEEIAKEVEPVIERQASKHTFAADDISWEGLMDPEALQAIKEAESQRA